MFSFGMKGNNIEKAKEIDIAIFYPDCFPSDVAFLFQLIRTSLFNAVTFFYCAYFFGHFPFKNSSSQNINTSYPDRFKTLIKISTSIIFLSSYVCYFPLEEELKELPILSRYGVGILSRYFTFFLLSIFKNFLGVFIS